MFNSIRTKLTFWYVGVLAAVVIAFSASAYLILVNALDRDLDNGLMEMARNFDAALTAELEDEKIASANERAFSETVNEMHFRDYQFVIVGAEGRVVASNANNNIDTLHLQGNSQFSDVVIDSQPFRLYRSTFGSVRDRNQIVLVVLHPLDRQNALKRRMAAIFLIGVPLTLILAGFGGWFLARKSLAPMVAMGLQAEQIGAQNLSERLIVKNERDELGDLARVFNDLLARLDASFEQQRRFMADASHELRTPLAILRGESEVALSQERSQADYRESLAIVHDESKRLTRIVEDLFTLARADAGQFIAYRTPVYFDEIAAEAVRSMHIIADKKGIELAFAADAGMPDWGDESLLRRLFLNMLDNAIKFTQNGGRVSVVCSTSDDAYHITVTDTGIGIPPDEQPNIFDRFYRVDKARSRSGDNETSGAGLGLSIAQWIADLHNGSIQLTSSGDTGSTFLIEFPRLKN